MTAYTSMSPLVTFGSAQLSVTNLGLMMTALNSSGSDGMSFSSTSSDPSSIPISGREFREEFSGLIIGVDVNAKDVSPKKSPNFPDSWSSSKSLASSDFDLKLVDEIKLLKMSCELGIFSPISRLPANFGS